MKLSDIEVNVDAVEQGTWIGAKHGTPIPEMGELCLKVRGTDNADYRRMYSKLANAIPRVRRQDMSEHDKVHAQCLNATCLLDWDGVDGPDGPVPYSKAQATELLTNPKWRKFREAVSWAAGMVGEQKAEEQALDEKN